MVKKQLGSYFVLLREMQTIPFFMNSSKIVQCSPPLQSTLKGAFLFIWMTKKLFCYINNYDMECGIMNEKNKERLIRVRNILLGVAAVGTGAGTAIHIHQVQKDAEEQFKVADAGLSSTQKNSLKISLMEKTIGIMTGKEYDPKDYEGDYMEKIKGIHLNNADNSLRTAKETLLNDNKDTYSEMEKVYLGGYAESQRDNFISGCSKQSGSYRSQEENMSFIKAAQDTIKKLHESGIKRTYVMTGKDFSSANFDR